MTIGEAIEIQIKIRDGEMDIPEDKWIASCNLGIEALYRCQELKNYTPKYIYMPLRGETEE